MAALNKGWKIVPPFADSVWAIALWLGAAKAEPVKMGDQGTLQNLLDEFGASGGQIERRRTGG